MTTRSLRSPNLGRVALHCARPNCTCRFQSRRLTRRRARAVAARYGWTSIGHVDLCECCTLRARALREYAAELRAIGGAA